MTLQRKIIALLSQPNRWLAAFVLRTARLWPDKTYLRIIFKARMGYPLDLDNPRSYSEKLQWLKLYDRRSEYTDMVDKYEAKKFASGIIGEQHVIPTIAVYDHAEDIDFETLPNQFVLKCTHDSGGIVICKDKSKLDKEAARRKLREGLSKNFYYQFREWPYKNVKPRLICEEYMVDESGYELKDYKWFCFDGEPKFLFIASDRGNPTEETKFDFYDMDFKHLPFTNGHPNAKRAIPKPTGFEKMKELASMLSKGIPHVRVDFYDINGHIYFGEMTFFHWSGFKPFKPKEWDYKFGEYIHLPER